MNSDSQLYVSWDEPLATALAVLGQGLGTIEQVTSAAQRRRGARPLIGMLALQQRKLTMVQVFRVLEVQAETGELFGLIAIKLGYLSDADLTDLLHQQAKLTPSLADTLASSRVLTLEQAALLRGQIQEQLRTQPDSQPLPSLA